MAYGKLAKKIMRKGKRYAKKRYLRKGAGYGTGVRLNKLSKDIRLIKNSLNTEKKYVDGFQEFLVGQVNGTVGGEHCQDVLPDIPQGTRGVGQRVGNSIKITGLAVKFQLVAQDPNFRVANGKFRFVIFEPMDDNETPIVSLQKLFQPNILTGITDYNSERDLQEYKNFRMVCNKSFTIPDGSDTGNAQYHQPTFMSRHFALKMSHHVKFDNFPSALTIKSGRLLWAVLCDHGNKSTSVVSTNADIPITAINTGYTMRLNIRTWYVDN